MSGATDLLRDRILGALDAWPAAGQPLPDALRAEAAAVTAELVAALEAGTVRAAEPDPDAPGGWRVNTWVKRGILLGFRIPGLRDYRDGPILVARDKVAYGVLDLLESEGARAALDAGAP